MRQNRMTRRAMLGLAGAALGAGSAAAHHGWSWAESEPFELHGTVREVYIGQPHPTLRVQTEGDGLWIVELNNPRATERSGFDARSAAAGDAVHVIGNRALTRSERRMKAVRLTVRDRTYDIYPDRIRRT
jgi:hypothetical protein